MHKENAIDADSSDEDKYNIVKCYIVIMCSIYPMIYNIQMRSLRENDEQCIKIMAITW